MPLPEKALIAEIRRVAKASPRRGSRRIVFTGIGDDCAILRPPPGQEILITTDFSLEGIHFRRDWHSPESAGHRSLARGLSDIAAMGGRPVAAFLSLGLPPDLPQPWVRGFADGLMRLAGKYGVTLAGGDTAESPNGVLADIIVVGTAPTGQSLLRSGARPGDRIFVSGALGGAAAAVVRLQSGGKGGKKEWARDGYSRHFYPEPRIELGSILREKRLASAMIDTSDGLSTDLAHLCEESGVGAEVDAALIPRAPIGKPARKVELNLALHGGEDYELIFTSPPGKKIPAEIAATPLTQVGRIVRKRKIVLYSGANQPEELEALGWQHFRP